VNETGLAVPSVQPDLGGSGDERVGSEPVETPDGIPVGAIAS